MEGDPLPRWTLQINILIAFFKIYSTNCKYPHILRQIVLINLPLKKNWIILFNNFFITIHSFLYIHIKIINKNLLVFSLLILLLKKKIKIGLDIFPHKTQFWAIILSNTFNPFFSVLPYIFPPNTSSDILEKLTILYIVKDIIVQEVQT